MAKLLPLSPKNREVLREVSRNSKPEPEKAHHTTLYAMERHGFIHFVLFKGYFLTQKGWAELGEDDAS